MLCHICKKNKLDSDFINNKNICYQCVYRKKTRKPVENRTGQVPCCRHCKKEIPVNKESKKRQRTVFCSFECAQVGHKKLTSNHWTRKVPKGVAYNGSYFKY